MGFVDAIAGLSWPTLALVWLGALLGGFASGAAGFALGIVASAIWLHVLEPVHVTLLIVCGGRAHPARDHLAAAPRAWSRNACGRFSWPDWSASRSAWRCSFASTPMRSRSASASFSPPTESSRCWRRPCRMSKAAALPMRRSASPAASWAASAAILACCRRSGHSCAAGPRRSPARSISLSSSWRTLLRSALIGAVALDRRGLVLLLVTLPALLIGALAGWRVYGRLDEQRFRQATGGDAGRVGPAPRVLDRGLGVGCATATDAAE